MASPVDPELQPIWNGGPDIGKPSDVAALRAIFAGRFTVDPVPPGAAQLPSHSVTSADGTPIEVLHFTPEPTAAETAAAAGHDQTATRPTRAVVFCFGGGLVMGNAASNVYWGGTIAEQTRSQVFLPGYRLAPEHPAPAALEDVYATLRYVQTHAAKLGVDPARVVLFGMSAGGGIAAGTALLARDRSSSDLEEEKLPLPAGVALRYPMLDDRTEGSDDDPLHRYHVWNHVANELGWTAYAGGKTRAERTDENMTIYMAPGRAKPEQLRGLPPVLVDVPELDFFRGEVTRFAGALAMAGVEVEFHHYPGLPHGIEKMMPGLKMVKKMQDNLYRFIHPRTLDGPIIQNLGVHLAKLGRRHRVILCRHAVDQHQEAEVDLDEAHVRVCVLAAGRRGHGEERTLGHGRQREEAQIALGASADGPGAVWVVLLHQVADCVAKATRKLTTCVNMLESRQLSGPDPIHHALDARIRCDIGHDGGYAI
ncbi:hypothetical protein PspLS_04587 [Pyricularia sp. CBS 133598]|nr:hypothetical protein PspLS_04587 [Pyricularia sp. CBS 133598]